MAPFPSMSLDLRPHIVSARDVAARLRAVGRTVASPGEGEVVVSRRAKLPGEKRRAVHGMAIANFLRANGTDPFAHPPEELARIRPIIARGIHEAAPAAYSSRTSQARTVQGALRHAAEELARLTVQRIISGGLGAVEPRHLRRKIRAIAGRIQANGITTKYGSPPARGIWSGRFIEGIRGRWRRGRTA